MNKNTSKPSLIALLAKIIIPLLLVTVGGVAWAYFKATAPVIERKPPQRQTTIVDVVSVVPKDTRPLITAMGTVVPSREVTIKSRVAGEVQSVAAEFIPGGHIGKNALLLSLDTSDLQVEVQKAQSALTDAQAALAIEQGNQAIAREELRLLADLSPETSMESDLALRKPQLQQAQAAIASAEADLHKARLNLKRTKVTVPFNALIMDRYVNTGTYVGAQENLATIVGTDEFWIEAVVPMDKLALIDFGHEDKIPVTVRSQTGTGTWPGRLVRVAGSLNETSRMATVIIAVADPLGLKATPRSTPLMIDDYVFVDIAGKPLTNVVELPRSALQDNNTVWVYANDTLDIRPVTIAWKGPDNVYIQDGLAPGERIITTQLSSPVQGMALKIPANQPENQPDSQSDDPSDLQKHSAQKGPQAAL